MTTSQDATTTTGPQDAAWQGGAEPVSMAMFHAALLRDFSRAQLLLTNPATLTRRRTGHVGRHLLWMVDALRVHHEGEDDHLWPLLSEREPASRTVLQQMLAEHHAIDAPMERLRVAATQLADHAQHDDTAAQRTLRVIEELLPPLRAHLEHEEAAALPVVRRVMSQKEWDTFESKAWASRRSVLGTARFAPWLLDGIQWTPTLQSRFAPARHLPAPLLRTLSSTSRMLGTPAWRGTTASTLPCPLVI